MCREGSILFGNDRTLKEVIEEVRWKKPGRKAQEEEAEAVCSFLRKFFGGNSKEKEHIRPDVLNWTISDISGKKDSFAAGLQEGVRSYPNDKYALVCRLEVLIEHLSLKYGLSFGSSLFENFKHRDKSERLLKLLKYLHSGEHSREEIAYHFGITQRALDNDLKELQDGYDFMNNHMRIERMVRGKNTYNSVIHPVFLTLRTDEIYSLTVGLKLLSKGTVFEQSLGHIANMVYKQLSDYARGVVDNHADGQTVSFEEEELEFISSEKYMERSSRAFAYYLKEPIECIITYQENEKREEIKGTMHLVEDGSRSFDKVRIEAEDSSKGLHIKDVLEVKAVSPYYDRILRRQ